MKKEKMMKETKILPFGIKAVICKSILSKTRGMMFRIKAKPLLFVFNNEKYIPIHMFFVFFPLITLWLSKEKKVVEFKILKPFSMYSPKTKSKYVLEIPFIYDKRSKIIAKKVKVKMQLKFRG